MLTMITILYVVCCSTSGDLFLLVARSSGGHLLLLPLKRHFIDSFTHGGAACDDRRLARICSRSCARAVRFSETNLERRWVLFYHLKRALEFETVGEQS